MKNFQFIIPALLCNLLFFSSTALAHGVTGDSFVESCKRGKFGEGFCLGYIQAIDEKIFIDATMKKPTTYCPNLGESTKIKLKKILNWLEKNPAYKSKPQPIAVMEALNSLYPCKQ